MSCVVLTLLLLAPAEVGLGGESRAAGKRLEQARTLIDSGNSVEAVGILLSLIDGGANELVPLADGRSVRTRSLAQALACRVGKEGLAEYRRQLSTRADKWLEEGNLHRVVDEAFCTESALVALDRLGDEAFLAGRFHDAELWWRQIARLDTDVDDDTQLIHPTPSESAAVRARAKQLLARWHARRSGWEEQRAAFARRYPHASGRLAGREGSYAETLRVLTALDRPPQQASEWPTFAGDSTRAGTAVGSLPELARLLRRAPTWQIDLATRTAPERGIPPTAEVNPVEEARRLAFHPVIAAGAVLVADGRTLTAYSLAAGRPETLFDLADHWPAAARLLTFPAALDQSHTLTVAEGLVYARLGASEIKDVRPHEGRPANNAESVLVAVSLRPGADGKRRSWVVRAMDEARKDYALFEGTPLVAHGRAYIAATRFSEDKVITELRCYPARLASVAPPLLWKTELCDTHELLPASAGAKTGKSRTRHHLLTLAGPNVVYCSHSGAIVAVNARTGERAWAFRYASVEKNAEEDEAPSLHGLLPPLYADGRLYIAPSQSSQLYCLDPLTGAIIWARDGLNAVQLLGVGKQRLIFSTYRSAAQGSLGGGGLRAVRADTGSDKGGWAVPNEEKGLLPMGRGVLLGDLVLWPTPRQPVGVIAVRQEDGTPSDNPTLLHRLPAGNLIVTPRGIVVAGRRLLHAFVPKED